MDNRSQLCMFYQSKDEVGEMVLVLEMWVWDMVAPRGGTGRKDRKKKERKET